MYIHNEILSPVPVYFAIDFLIRSQFSYTSSYGTKSNFSQINIFFYFIILFLLRVCSGFPPSSHTPSTARQAVKQSQLILCCVPFYFTAVAYFDFEKVSRFRPSNATVPYCKSDFRSIQRTPCAISNNSIHV